MASVGKKRLLIAFSGGETSAYMAQWLWKNKQKEYEMLFAFANTGVENEETFNFVHKCEVEFGINVNWLEAVIDQEKGKGTRHKIVDYKTASRNGEPFEELIKKYGLPNQQRFHCTRELKNNTLISFAKSVWGKEKYYLAIGIRVDEFDRMNDKFKELRIVYPLISEIPMTKPKINFWWKQQSFRLELKGYQGNCVTCYKKSDKKLFQIAKENPSAFDFFDRMEEQYGEGKYQFFRQNRTAKQIMEQAKEWNGNVIDDAQNVTIQTDLFSESCEAFTSDCGV